MSYKVEEGGGRYGKMDGGMDVMEADGLWGRENFEGLLDTLGSNYYPTSFMTDKVQMNNKPYWIHIISTPLDSLYDFPRPASNWAEAGDSPAL